jgi:tetratricopeptide (TPR) repeat protein
VPAARDGTGERRTGTSQGRGTAIPASSRPRDRTLAEEIRASARPGRSDRALRAFEEAVGLLERGRDAAALGPAREAKELAPRSGAVREALGIALYRTEHFHEALVELQAYRRISGRADQNHLIADSHRALGAPLKAVSAAREAIRARIPEEARAEAAVVGAAALADLGRYSEALGLLNAVKPGNRAIRPFDLRIWYVTGDVLERAGRRQDAVQEFRRVMRHDPGAFDAAERLARLEG